MAAAVALLQAGCGALLGVDFSDASDPGVLTAADASGSFDGEEATTDATGTSGGDAETGSGEDGGEAGTGASIDGGADASIPECIDDVAAACAGKCGTLRTGTCGRLVDCGACAQGQTCGGAGPNVCGAGPCTATCTGKACGASDGCGGVCASGSCGEGQRCAAGTCVCDATSCPGCCRAGLCLHGATDDTCGRGGTSCVMCPAGTRCSSGTCGCTPSCAGKACGASDGCGGVCTQGTCPAGSRCQAGVCAETAATKLVLFGGVGSGSTTGSNAMFDDTWEWNGQSWTRRIVSTDPPARSDAAMARHRDKLVLFGGQDFDGLMDDTWEWDGRSWSRRHPTNSPAARRGAMMARLGDKLVLFGGSTRSSPVNDTWEWDGENWAPRTPRSSPPARHGAAMATLGGKVVLFGGRGHSETFSDTWEWDGENWTQRAAPAMPRVFSVSMAPLNGTLVLFIGSWRPPETWEWNGERWDSRPSEMRPPFRHGDALSPLGDKVVLFGGRGETSFSYRADTWEWDGARWTQRTLTTAPPARGGAVMAPFP